MGIERAKGAYILTLDVDNKIRPDYLRRAADVLDAKAETGVVYADYQVFGAVNKQKKLPGFDISKLLYHNYIDACSVFRKKAWEDAGGFPGGDFNAVFFEDWDFWLSIVERGWQFFHFSEVMFDYRKKTTSRTSLAESQTLKYSELVFMIYSKHAKLAHQQYRYLFQALERINRNPVIYPFKHFACELRKKIRF